MFECAEKSGTNALKSVLRQPNLADNETQLAVTNAYGVSEATTKPENHGHNIKNFWTWWEVSFSFVWSAGLEP